MSWSRACGSRQPSRRPNFSCHAVGAGRELAHLLLVPARPADLGGVRALARGRHHAPVDEQEVAVGVKAELRLHPGAALGRDVLVPHRRRLHDVAVAVEHREVLARARGHRRASLSSFDSSTIRAVYYPESRRRLSMERRRRDSSASRCPGASCWSPARRGGSGSRSRAAWRRPAPSSASTGATRRAPARSPAAFRMPSPPPSTSPTWPRAAVAIDAIVARHGRLDCLVNNAAVRDRRPLAGHHRRRLPPRARDQSGGAVRAVSRGRAAHGGARPGAARLRLLDGGAAVVPGRSGLRRVEGRARGARCARSRWSSARRASPPTRSRPASS